jgi:hypothetical protein
MSSNSCRSNFKTQPGQKHRDQPYKKQVEVNGENNGDQHFENKVLNGRACVSQQKNESKRYDQRNKRHLSPEKAWGRSDAKAFQEPDTQESAANSAAETTRRRALLESPISGLGLSKSLRLIVRPSLAGPGNMLRIPIQTELCNSYQRFRTTHGSTRMGSAGQPLTVAEFLRPHRQNSPRRI